MDEATDLVTAERSLAAARAVDAVKIYGHGDASVRALDGITVATPPPHPGESHTSASS